MKHSFITRLRTKASNRLAALSLAAVGIMAAAPARADVVTDVLDDATGYATALAGVGTIVAGVIALRVGLAWAAKAGRFATKG